MSLLNRKDKMKAITTATKICRMNETVFNQKYKGIRKELENINTDKKRKQWLSIILDRLETHLDKKDEAFANQTIPDYGE